MTCHAARRIGEFERRLRRERREAYDALITAGGELAGCERHHPGDFLDDAATGAACGVLARLEERDRRVLPRSTRRRRAWRPVPMVSARCVRGRSRSSSCGPSPLRACASCARTSRSVLREQGWPPASRQRRP